MDLRNPPDPYVEYIRITPLTPPELAPDDEIALRATAHYSNDHEVEITDAGTWSSSDDVVAMVDSAGIVTAVSGGTALVTFTFKDLDDRVVQTQVEISVSGAVVVGEFIVFRRTIAQPADGADFFVDLPSSLPSDTYAADGELVVGDDSVAFSFPDVVAGDRTTDHFRMLTTVPLADGDVIELTVSR